MPRLDTRENLRLNTVNLHRTLDDSLQIRHIMEPLETCKPDDPAMDVQKLMMEEHYDVLGVEQNGTVVGYVVHSQLSVGKTISYIHKFAPGEFIASTTPLIEALPLFKDRDWLFVLERTEIRSLVTIGDLQKPPVRMLLFSLISLLEMHFLHLVQVCYPGDSFQERLTYNRLEKAKGRLAELSKRNQEISLLACLQIIDKTNLLLEVVGLMEHLCLGTREEAKQFFKDLQSLRDDLSHGNDLGVGLSWKDTIQATERIEKLLRDCEGRWDEFVKRFGKKESA
jgi:CBS domain-containing protein